MSHNAAYRMILGRMGYYEYQERLMYRRLNQSEAWDLHLRRCRDFILKAMDLLKPDKVTVLGSGWLLDLPLAEMAERTGTIVLTDIIHPPDVIKQAGAMANVTITETDVTGGLIGEVWRKSRGYSFLRKLRSLDGIEIPAYEPADDPGMVISLNILTQLESQLVRFLEKRSGISDPVFLEFRRRIQLQHIEFLRRYSSVLITDTAEIITDFSGKVSEEPTLLAELPEGKYTEEWEWEYDRGGSDYYTRRSSYLIKGVII